MFLLIWIRKVYKVLSADASPSAIAFGVLYGLVLGFVPLWSGLGMFLLASLLVLRVQISSTLLVLGIGKGLSLLGLSALFVPLGEMLLEPQAFHGFWTWFLNLPVAAWFDLHYHAVVGGAVLGLLLGLALFWPVRQLVISYRRYLHDPVSSNRFFRWLTSFWLVKGLRFVFVGVEA